MSATQNVAVTLPDGRRLDVPPGTRLSELEGAPAEGAIAARLDGEPVDLARPLEATDAPVAVSYVKPDDVDALEILRHSTSHVLAQAVKELYPEVKIAQGPAIVDGFYYDFRRETAFTEDELAAIEERMREIVARDLPIERHEVAKDDAVALFRNEEEPYKLYFVETKSGPVASYYEQGEFRDFCRGPHVPSTGRLAAFKLLSAAGAYWLGSERNEMLWRIYGTAFPTQEALDAHLEKIEEAKKRDHRRLGKELDLFSVQEVAGSGVIFWHPRGELIKHQIERYLREELERRDYVFVSTPHLARDQLFRISGHYDYYHENMFTLTTGEDEEMVVKPMNCPGHVMVYKSRLRSYRDLPIRMAEFGTVYRNERSGTLSGLLRVRGFTQDDAHIFCSPDQIVDEILDCLDLVEKVFKTFGFANLKYELSVRDDIDPDKYAGEPAQWAMATEALEKALAVKDLSYERYEGEAAFYGPKIDVKVVDALGRPWQLSTIQFDFNLPSRFGISFVDTDGAAHSPFMVHRAIYGSIERFFGILIEHFGGVFPVWLAPLQVKVLPVSAKAMDYGQSVVKELRDAGLRAELDERPDKVGAKIRDAELEKVPYMLIVGPREAEARTVSLRIHRLGDQGGLPLTEFTARALERTRSRELEP